MSSIYFEDVVVGYVEESSEAVVDGVEMVRYAEQNDPHAIHIDEAFARSTPFGKRVASFGYVVSLYLRLIHTLEFARAQLPAFLGGLEWRVQFHHPVYADDRLHVRLAVTDKRLTSRGDRGLVTSRYEIVNQHEATVITIDVVTLLATRSHDHDARRDV